MLKYAKVIDDKIGLVQVGTENSPEAIEIYKLLGFIELDIEQSEKDNGWYLTEKCPHYTQEEIDQKKKEKRRQEILNELDKLDLKSIRAIRANDQEYLVKYEAQAEELRKQLKELSGE